MNQVRLKYRGVSTFVTTTDGAAEYIHHVGENFLNEGEEVGLFEVLFPKEIGLIVQQAQSQADFLTRGTPVEPF